MRNVPTGQSGRQRGRCTHEKQVCDARDAGGTQGCLFIGGVLRDDGTLQLTRLENVTAVDWKDHFEMVYHLFSPTELHWLTLKVMLPHDAPVLPSATSVFPGAEFEEREVYDLMGIVFTGHPDLRRVFHADDFVGHPLRKDFVPPPPPAVPSFRKEEF